MPEALPPTYTLRLTRTAARSLAERLPPAVAAAVVELLRGDLLTAPRWVGRELSRELAGTWAARRGTYRVLYEIHDAEAIVLVVDIDHRSDVYRRR